ncbi:hypothetical protein C8J57DRAFT_1506962 [Mycena rebaudengoi]|nr:hypothetical protein C8J57DRAFT_1506962 [Mycena rebaudengoi]
MFSVAASPVAVPAEKPETAVDKALATKLLDILENYGLTNNFGVVAVHSHMSLAEGEVIFQHGNASSVSQAIEIYEDVKDSGVPYTYRITDGALLPLELRESSPEAVAARGELAAATAGNFLSDFSTASSGHLAGIAYVRPLDRAALESNGVVKYHYNEALTAGFTAAVFEVSALNKEVGAAIIVPPNATRILERLGYSEKNPRAVDYEGILIYSGMSEGGTGAIQNGSKYDGFQSCMCRRTDLQDELKRLALDEEGSGTRVHLHLSTHIVDCEPEAGILTSKSGEKYEADDIIAADGINGRVLLLGDAAHATFPTLGRGAAMAVEEAATIGCLLPSGATREQVPSRLEAHQILRKERGEFVGQESADQIVIPAKRGLYFRSPDMQDYLLGHDAIRVAQEFFENNLYRPECRFGNT